MTVTEEHVTIQLGTTRIALPDPLAEPWRELAANPAHELTASPSTIERHATDSAAAYAQYIAAVRT